MFDFNPGVMSENEIHTLIRRFSHPKDLWGHLHETYGVLKRVAVLMKHEQGIGDMLLRHAGYPISAVQPEPPASPGIPLASRVTACSFNYEPGSATRAGLVVIRLTVSELNLDGDREPLTVLEQVHIPNSP